MLDDVHDRVQQVIGVVNRLHILLGEARIDDDQQLDAVAHIVELHLVLFYDNKSLLQVRDQLRDTNTGVLLHEEVLRGTAALLNVLHHHILHEAVAAAHQEGSTAAVGALHGASHLVPDIHSRVLLVHLQDPLVRLDIQIVHDRHVYF